MFVYKIKRERERKYKNNQRWLYIEYIGWLWEQKKYRN